MKIKVACLALLTLILLVPNASFAFLEEEAGISAYGYLTGVNLALAENAYKTVETKTNDYIIGSVALIDYGEEDDVHVYLNTSGWIVAYYNDDEKASKIIDWKDYTGGEITSTKLEDAITLVCAEMGLVKPDVTYWDFREADATDIMIVTDEKLSSGEETFLITVPSAEISMHSRTWSHAIHSTSGNTYNSSISVDEFELHSGSITDPGWKFWEGDIESYQLIADTPHEFLVWTGSNYVDAYIGVVLIYSQSN